METFRERIYACSILHNGLAMRSAGLEALHFHFTTKFLYLHNLSIYDNPRITYEPLLPAVFHWFKVILIYH